MSTDKVKAYLDFLQRMGSRYTTYRIKHALRGKTGFYRRKFPTEVEGRHFTSLSQWRIEKPNFYFDHRSVTFHDDCPKKLSDRINNMADGKFEFFGNVLLHVDIQNLWHKNPKTGHLYNAETHWSLIADLSKEAGDIKWVWEIARFSFIWDYLRHDAYTATDHSAHLFGMIEDFIDSNPINLGPQYKCSQEISLRILNWTAVLYYYSESEVLTSELFDKIFNHIYWQLKHVFDHIDFSRIAVRNNHAVTESMMLYLSGILFPFIPETDKWSNKGKLWLEQEIDYQIYNDGGYIQFSINYHRVMAQLLTWAFRLSSLNGRNLSDHAFAKANSTLQFLDAFIDQNSGTAPNHGANDGALFFPLNEDDRSSYISQINDLRATLHGSISKGGESQRWYGFSDLEKDVVVSPEVRSFHDSGYFLLNEQDDKTLIICNSYRDRPAQDDNLHLDLWHDGKNLLWDNGTFSYNTDDVLRAKFAEAQGHNTVTLDALPHMKRLGRFIWSYWIDHTEVEVIEDNDEVYIIEAGMMAYKYMGGVSLKRRLVKFKGRPHWEITDAVSDAKAMQLIQHWYLNPDHAHDVSITARTAEGNLIDPEEIMWPHADYYGSYRETPSLHFKTSGLSITTQITYSA